MGCVRGNTRSVAGEATGGQAPSAGGGPAHVPARPASTARSRRGFTLLEIMVVVSIVALAVSMVYATVTRRQTALGVADAGRQLRTRVTHARALAAMVGPRMGTPQLVNAAACNAVLPNELQVILDPAQNTYTVPETVFASDTNPDVFVVQCSTYDLGALTRGAATLGFPADRTAFGFTALGRLRIFAPAAAGAPSLFVRVDGPDVTARLGFRVLASGVVCAASELAGPTCDMDQG